MRSDSEFDSGFEIEKETRWCYLTNEEYLAKFGAAYKKLMSLRKDDDYIINEKQAVRLVQIMNFFMDAAKKLGGHVEPLKLVPHEEHGGVTATFLVFDISGDDVKQFCNVMKHASTIGIEATDDGICIDCTVPNIFIRK